MTVTNVGPTHLEFLGTVQGVAREKLQAMNFAAPGGSLIVNADDLVLMTEVREIHSHPITYGIESKADFKPTSIRRLDGGAEVTIEGHLFRLPLFGQYQVYNLLAAYAIARTVGCNLENIDTESLALATAAMRGELIVASGITFVADCYNANPDSVKAGLASFVNMSGGRRKVVILGDMLELGDSAGRYHKQVGAQLATLSFDLVIGVGPLSRQIVDSAAVPGVSADKLYHFEDSEACAKACDDLLKSGDLVYLKGSRGIGLEVVLKKFTNREEEA